MAFIDERLLDRVAYGFSGGPTWATTRVTLTSGRSKRNAERSQPLHRYSAPYQNIQHEAHYSLIVDSYNACLGPVHAFRFKDYLDYELNDVVIGTSDGSANETMQIVKPYTFGVNTLNRNITKPVDSTVYTDATPLSVTADNTPISFSVDYATGIITINAAFGEVIRVTGEFDVPVHFDDDQLDFDYGNWEHVSGDIVLLEDFSA